MAARPQLSIAKVAAQCCVSRTTVYRWIASGHLPGRQLANGHYRVDAQDLDAFCISLNLPAFAAVKAGRSTVDGRLNVLIADDHPDVVLLLRKVTERYLPDAAIHQAINGVDTCIAAGTIRPHLMLLDIMMPGMDGFAVLTDLLVRPELQETKVVILSAYEPFDRIEELARLHPQVVGCLRKPISVETLGRMLKELSATIAVAAVPATAGIATE